MKCVRIATIFKLFSECFYGESVDGVQRGKESSRHTLAPMSYPPFLCICAWRFASCAIDMSMSPLLMCAVCLKFVGTPIMLLSIRSLRCCCCCDLAPPLLFRVLAGRDWVKQHAKHWTNSSVLPAISSPLGVSRGGERGREKEKERTRWRMPQRCSHTQHNPPTSWTQLCCRFSPRDDWQTGDGERRGGRKQDR